MMRYGTAPVVLFFLFSNAARAEAFSLRINTGNYMEEGVNDISVDPYHPTDIFYVLLENISKHSQSIEYVTCSEPIISKLHFELRDKANTIHTIACGPFAQSSAVNSPFPCEGNGFGTYSVPPKESIVLPINYKSCAWDRVPQEMKLPNYNSIQSIPVIIRAIFRLNDKQAVASDWRSYNASIYVEPKEHPKN